MTLRIVERKVDGRGGAEEMRVALMEEGFKKLREILGGRFLLVT